SLAALISASSGSWSASLWPPMKLYLAKPVHLAAAGGRPGANKASKSSNLGVLMRVLVSQDSAPCHGYSCVPCLPEVLMHRRALLASAGSLSLVFATAALAEYPDHPIRMVVPQAAGSSTDTLTRVLAAALADELHQQVVVDDRPGGALTL